MPAPPTLTVISLDGGGQSKGILLLFYAVQRYTLRYGIW